MATITRAQGSQVGLAFAFAALCSAAIVATSPILFPEPAETAVFMVFWSSLFTFSGIMTGFNLEITRSIAAELPDARLQPALDKGTPRSMTEVASPSAIPKTRREQKIGIRVVAVAGIIGLIVSALLAMTAPLWGHWQFPSHPVALALVVALGVAGCGFYHGVGGSLAGSGRWSTYAGLVSADSGLRLLLVIGLAIVTRSVVATAVGAAVAFFVWSGFWAFSSQARLSSAARIRIPLKTLLFRFGAAALASGASAVLVIGFPALLSLTTDPRVIDDAAPLILALTLTRAPLMIPLNAAQGVVISHFAQNRNLGIKTLLPIFGVALAVGAVAVGAAWLLGPWLLYAFWGPTMVVSGPLLGALTAGATGLALVTLSGAVCQSLTLHRSFVLGWVTAVGAAFIVLLFPLPLETRAALALGIGPLAGIAIHLMALRNSAMPDATPSVEEASIAVSKPSGKSGAELLG